MHKHWSVLRFSIFPLLALAPVAGRAGEPAASAGRDPVNLGGRHALAVRVGTLGFTTRNTFSPGGMSSGTSSDVLGELSYSHWLTDDWSIGLSAGALVLGAETGTSGWAAPTTMATDVPGVAEFRSAAVTTVLLNVGYHPARLSIARSVRPYVSLGFGPYVTSGEKVRVGTGVVVGLVSDTVFGARALAGADWYLGRHFKLGLSAGYRFMGEFDEPIRSYRSYSGPEFSFGFGVLVGGGEVGEASEVSPTMKILLIEPAKSSRTFGGEDVSLFEPLALEYLGAAVAKDHDVRILDLRIENGLRSTLDEFHPDVVGITAYTVHVNTVRGLFEDIKRWDPETLTVVGGHHATVLPADFESPSVDVVVMGEGVTPFQEIVARRERAQALCGIPGTAVRGPEALVHCEPQPVPDLDALPLPDRTLTAAHRKRYYSDWMRPLASMRTSRGCPFRCSFCALWKLAEGRYLKRRPEAIVAELASIDEEFVFFADDESLVDARRMLDLARRIRAAGLEKRFFLYGRSDTIARNPDLLEAWRDVGLERVFVGLEFATDENLQYIRKGSTANDNDAAVRVLQGLGIEIYASFIVRPEFERRDFTALRRYCRQLGLGYATFAVLTPLPGTDLYAEVKDRLISHDYDDFDFIHTLLPTTLPLRDFYAEYCDLYRKAVSPAKQLAFLARHRWRDIPPLLRRSNRLLARLRTMYLDYEVTAAVPPGSVGTRRPNA